ncbi:MAG: hypothetical protein ACKO37_06950 [Vampirovibrionales bacterium]
MIFTGLPSLSFTAHSASSKRLVSPQVPQRLAHGKPGETVIEGQLNGSIPLELEGYGIPSFKTPKAAQTYLKKNKTQVCNTVREAAGYVQRNNPGLTVNSLSAIVSENRRNGSTKTHESTSCPVNR